MSLMPHRWSFESDCSICKLNPVLLRCTSTQIRMYCLISAVRLTRLQRHETDRSSQCQLRFLEQRLRNEQATVLRRQLAQESAAFPQLTRYLSAVLEDLGVYVRHSSFSAPQYNGHLNVSACHSAASLMYRPRSFWPKGKCAPAL